MTSTLSETRPQNTLELAQQVIEDVRVKLRRGAQYEACMLEAEPALEIINQKGAEIAKQHGRKFKKLSFSYLMR